MTLPKRAWLLVGAVTTVLALVASALTVWAYVSEGAETQRQTYLRPIAQLDLDIRGADVTIVPGAAGIVEVERELRWSLVRPVIIERWDGDTLRIEVVCTGEPTRSCAVDYTLSVPVDVPISADSQRGDLTVRDVTGHLQLTARSGDIAMVNTRGAVRAYSWSGGIRLSGSRSPEIQAHAKSGDVAVGAVIAPESLFADSDAGNIVLLVPAGVTYAVDAETEAGVRRVDIDDDSTSVHHIAARTESGNLSIGYAP